MSTQPRRRLLATCDTPADLGALITLREHEVWHVIYSWALGKDWAMLAGEYHGIERMN